MLVVLEISEDRAHANRVLAARPKTRHVRRDCPGRFLAPRESPLPSANRSNLSADAAKVAVWTANQLVEFRKAVDRQLDAAVERLWTEMTAAENETRDHVRYVMVGSVRKRVIGAAALAVGILLEIAGAVIPAL